MPIAKSIGLAAAVALVAGLAVTPAWAQDRKHNVILFVPDGLRALSVTSASAPAMAGIRDSGVNFRSPHSLFPTFTMANSSGMSMCCTTTEFGFSTITALRGLHGRAAFPG